MVTQAYSYQVLEKGLATVQRVTFPEATPRIDVHSPAVVMPHFTLWSGGQVDASLLHHNAHQFAARYQSQLTRAQESPAWRLPVPDGEEWCLLGGHPNFYHFVVNYLPRVGYYRTPASEGPRKKRYVTANDLPPRYYEYLARLGISGSNLVLVPRDARIEISRLTIASLPVYFGLGAITADLNAIDWLRRQFGVDSPKAGERIKVFLTRKHTTHRRIINEDAIFDLAAEQGFKRICPEDLSLEELLATMRLADVLVTPFGAGAVNSLFCPRDAAVIELLGPPARGKYNGVHLCAAVGQRTLRIICDEANESLAWQYRDLHVNERDFALALGLLDRRSE